MNERSRNFNNKFFGLDLPLEIDKKKDRLHYHVNRASRDYHTITRVPQIDPLFSLRYFENSLFHFSTVDEIFLSPRAQSTCAHFGSQIASPM